MFIFFSIMSNSQSFSQPTGPMPERKSDRYETITDNLDDQIRLIKMYLKILKRRLNKIDPK